MLLQSQTGPQLILSPYLTVIADFSQSTDLQMTIILIAAALKLIISECLICVSVIQCQLHGRVSVVFLNLRLEPAHVFIHVCVSATLRQSPGAASR